MVACINSVKNSCQNITIIIIIINNNNNTEQECVHFKIFGNCYIFFLSFFFSQVILLAHQDCIYLTKNTLKINIVKYNYNLNSYFLF